MWRQGPAGLLETLAVLGALVGDAWMAQGAPEQALAMTTQGEGLSVLRIFSQAVHSEKYID